MIGRAHWLVVGLTFAGCGPASREGFPGGGEGGADAAPFTGQDGPGCQKMDVVFVIDDSGSMEQEQSNLAANFPAFVRVLDESRLDYRIAVTTTGRDHTFYLGNVVGPPLPVSVSGGTNGHFRSACGMTRRWIEKSDPDSATTFACIANVGIKGPINEMPLSAMRDAFEERIADGSNVGFRRPDALLGLVFLTDENDCSYERSVTIPFGQRVCESMLEPVGNYVAFLDQYTQNRSRWAAAVIAGPGPGVCESDLGFADPAPRLIDFVTQSGPNAVMSSICEGDLASGLARALSTFSSACASFEPVD